MRRGKFIYCIAVAAFLVVAHFCFGELTLETGDSMGEMYFLLQVRLTSSGAKSHRLSGMSAFSRAYQERLIDTLEILEIREMNTDQNLPFTYIPVRSGSSSKGPELMDIAWYYPNPIPSGGEAKVMVRGKFVSSRVYSGTSDRVSEN